MDIDVSLLGPVEVVGPAGPAPLIGTRQRAIVALLALQPGTVLSRSRLVDALWGQDAPRTAEKTVNSHIARIRQALEACGATDLLVTQDRGYALAAPPQAVDANRFEELVRRGRAELAAGDLDAAAARLAEALDLWRGDVAEGLELAGWGGAALDRLREARLEALGDRWDIELRRGGHERATAELEQLLVTYPTRERLVGLLMLARYRCGWPTAALAAYQRLRAALADELGVDPGPGLQALYAAILRRDPALEHGSVPERAVVSTMDDLAVRPAQLPAPVGHFTGRVAELAGLAAILPGSGGEARVAVISGAPGAGKTALAVQWAHQVKDQFPDGQLFLDLRGHDRDAALPAAAALAHLLRGLGVAADRVPAAVADQVALYRSLLHDQRVLILLDDAGGVDDIVPLVPAATASALVVTSRSRLAGLGAHHAVRAVPLDVLRPGEAVALLGRALPERVAAEPAAALRLAELCDRLPLALRIATAKLAARPSQRIQDLVDELTAEDRLGALALAGDSRNIRAVLDSAYRGVSPPAARLFRLLSGHPGPTASRHLAAAVAGTSAAEIRPALDELAAAHLLLEVDRDRYRYHDLVRQFARERAGIEDTPGARAAAGDRLIEWYVAVAGAANAVVDPGRDRVSVAAPSEPPFAADQRTALAFLDAERDNFGPVVRFAAARGGPAAWQLTYLLTGFFDSRGHWTERVAMCRAGLAAAQREGDPAVEGLMRSALGVAAIMTRDFDEALGHLEHALELMRRCGDRRGEGHVWNNIAVALSHLRRFDEAGEAYRHALDIHRDGGHPIGRAVALINLSEACVEMGDPGAVPAHLGEAMRLSLELGNERLEAAVHNGLGLASLARGAPGEAREHFHRALALRTRGGDRRYAAQTWNDLGLAHLRGGDPVAAADAFRQALALSREIADLHVAAVAYHRLGLSCMDDGDHAGARRSLVHALRLRGRVPDPYEEAHLHRALGNLDWAGGNRAAANHHWDLAVELYRKASAKAEADELAARCDS